ncbi:MAG: hypothetical protein JWQ40_1431 [Segetibacter sp.]|nr:hypothetical protein [Segetibacter sp.]
MVGLIGEVTIPILFMSLNNGAKNLENSEL